MQSDKPIVDVEAHTESAGARKGWHAPRFILGELNDTESGGGTSTDSGFGTPGVPS
jgi:hypothetical protein